MKKQEELKKMMKKADKIASQSKRIKIKSIITSKLFQEIAKAADL